MKSLYLLALTTILLSCNDFKVTTTDEGDRIIFHKDEDGDLPNEGEIMMVDLKIQDENDTTYRDSFKDGQPIRIDLMKGGFKGSFENALFHLTAGDSCTVLVPADSIFMRMGQPLPPGLKNGSDLKFTVRVKEVLNQEQYEESMKKLFAKEGDTIKEYVTKNLPGADSLGGTGMYVLRKTAGKGSYPQPGDMVSVYYKGTLMDGTVFDQVQKGEDPFTFPVGVSRVIKGWDAAVMRMTQGESISVIIPSRLAYGESGAGGVIPPNSPLVFDIELVKIEKSK